MKRYNLMAGLAVLLLVTSLAGCAIPLSRQPASQQPAPAATQSGNMSRLVTLDSPSPLVAVKIMLRAGSAADPVGKEGLANLVAASLIQGSFGNPAQPVTKERLAEITQPWGEGAMPYAQVAAETTTFHMTIPRDELGSYLSQVLRPMLTTPQFAASEIDRLRNETSAVISVARSEDLEGLGLSAIEMSVLEGTRYQHQPFGTDDGLAAITRDDVVSFFRSHYRPGNVILGVSTSDPAVVSPISVVVNEMNEGVAASLSAPRMGTVTPIAGRQVTIIEQPNAPAASLHLGFPITVDRLHPDYWPLYVANTWLGTHRDSTGHLYQMIRQERGYNYGNYSYIEHWNGRTGSLFQIFNQPRSQQYFSIWVRPVQHEYAYPLMKAITWELDNLVANGLSDQQVASAKNKAKVLYVNLGETVSRLLAAKMDDAFYGSDPGFLEGYLENVDRVTTAQVNSAIRRHLQTANLKYVVITNSASVPGLTAQIRGNQASQGKSFADYEFPEVKRADGSTGWEIPEARRAMVERDALWASYPLNIGTVRVTPVGSLFKTGTFIAR